MIVKNKRFHSNIMVLNAVRSGGPYFFDTLQNEQTIFLCMFFHGQIHRVFLFLPQFHNVILKFDKRRKSSSLQCSAARRDAMLPCSGGRNFKFQPPVPGGHMLVYLGVAPSLLNDKSRPPLHLRYFRSYHIPKIWLPILITDRSIGFYWDHMFLQLSREKKSSDLSIKQYLKYCNRAHTSQPNWDKHST